MACPDGPFTSEMFNQAMQQFNLWEFTICPYGGPMSILLVGTVLYSGISINIFTRTGSIMIPFVLAMILGGTVLAQTLAIINSFAAVIILVGAPLAVSALVFSVDRRT